MKRVLGALLAGCLIVPGCTSSIGPPIFRKTEPRPSPTFTTERWDHRAEVWDFTDNTFLDLTGRSRLNPGTSSTLQLQLARCRSLAWRTTTWYVRVRFRVPFEYQMDRMLSLGSAVVTLSAENDTLIFRNPTDHGASSFATETYMFLPVFEWSDGSVSFRTDLEHLQQIAGFNTIQVTFTIGDTEITGDLIPGAILLFRKFVDDYGSGYSLSSGDPERNRR
ncbi:hypothetical protein ACFL6R_04380 [Gemmatimonadota bacterium]